MSDVISLPTAAGTVEYALSGRSTALTRAEPPRSRVAYAAVPVVADPLTVSTAAGPGCVDWERTLAQRARIWDLGLGVAEAMDTAQRGMGIEWPDVRRLVRETLAAGRARGGATVVGVATDTLPPGPCPLGRIVDAYLEQLDFVEGLGGTAVLMASGQLAATAGSAEDYLTVYDAVLATARRPVVLHWLGTDFDAGLAGYWGSSDLPRAADTVVDLVADHADRVEGVKVSVLSPAVELDLRKRLPAAVKVFTGDDFHYVELIGGAPDGTHSHALLGAFAAVAPLAREALGHLDRGDLAAYRRVLGPTEALARLIFAAPTRYYKAGIAWLAYLQGQQPHFRMLGGVEAGRSVLHLVEVFTTADRIGLFHDPHEAAGRLRSYLRAHGLG